jgi:hypothetical protein
MELAYLPLPKVIIKIFFAKANSIKANWKRSPSSPHFDGRSGFLKQPLYLYLSTSLFPLSLKGALPSVIGVEGNLNLYLTNYGQNIQF